MLIVYIWEFRESTKTRNEFLSSMFLVIEKTTNLSKVKQMLWYYWIYNII